jgi:MoaA/NifB/PqqE/SkfB family radical SAM enzyme
MLKTLVRFETRKKLGISLDRRLRNGWSAPPVNVSLNLTRRCNLRCSMCIQHRHTETDNSALPWYNPHNELPLEPWVTLLDEMVAFRPWVFVTGGEPLLYPDIRGFLQETAKRSLPVHIATNGTLLHTFAECIVENGVAVVFVSLDGPEAVHDRIRGQEGVFQRTLEGVRSLLETRDSYPSPGPIVGINCTMSRDNIDVLSEMVPLAVELGVDVMKFQHTIFDTQDNVNAHNRVLSTEMAKKHGLDMVHPSIPEGEFYESDIGPEDAERIKAVLQHAKTQAAGKVRLEFLPNLPEDRILPYYNDLGFPFPDQCNQLWKTSRILPDGTFSPCLHVIIGNIRHKPLLELWNDPKMRTFRKLIANGLFPGCARCCSRSF